MNDNKDYILRYLVNRSGDDITVDRNSDELSLEEIVYLTSLCVASLIRTSYDMNNEINMYEVKSVIMDNVSARIDEAILQIEGERQ